MILSLKFFQCFDFLVSICQPFSLFAFYRFIVKENANLSSENGSCENIAEHYAESCKWVLGQPAPALGQVGRFSVTYSIVNHCSRNHVGTIKLLWIVAKGCGFMIVKNHCCIMKRKNYKNTELNFRPTSPGLP